MLTRNLATIQSLLATFTLLLMCSTTMAQDYDSLIQQAVAQRNAGDMAAAEATLREAYVIPPNKTEVGYLLGMVVAFQERYGEALELLETVLADHPEDVSLNLGKARVLSFQGRYRQAEAIIEPILAADPNNTEALNLAGRIAWYQQQNNRARDYFERSLVIRDNDLDTLVSLYDVELASGNEDDADRYLAMAAAVDADHIDVLSRQNPAEFSTSPRHEITATYANSDFNLPGFPQWYERSVEYRHLGVAGNQQYVRAEHNHRFGAHDTFVEAGLLFNQTGALPLSVAIGGTVDADFMPEHLFRLGSQKLIHEATDKLGTIVLTGQYQHTRYGNGDVDRLLVGLEYYLLNANAWLTPSVGFVRDQDGLETFAWALGAHWQVTGATRVGISYSDAPETENQITTDTNNYQAYIRHALQGNLALLVYFSRHERQNSYTRENLNLGLQYRF